MTTRIKRIKKRGKDAVLDTISNPRQNLDGFDVSDIMQEIESAVTDAGDYLQRMERNENTRLCRWPDKDKSGRKVSKRGKPAKPWENAADHEVQLAQEVLLQLTALRSAAMVRGALNVTPMESSDVKAAGQMKLVLRYFLENCLRGEKLIASTRWASWALRYGHAVMYVGWKTTKALEQRWVKKSELAEFLLAQQIAGVEPGPNGEPPMILPNVRQVIEQRIDQDSTPEELAQVILQMRPGLLERGKAAMGEAVKCVKEMRADTSADPKGSYFGSFIKENRPTLEALRQGIDFFCPAETQHEETMDSARWLYRLRWLSVAQVREEGAARGWDPQWVLEVIEKGKGKPQMFTSLTQQTPWALTGLGVGYTLQWRDFSEGQKHMIQIGELYDRSTTADGIQCIHKTVLHPDVKDRVAKRELLQDWHGHYPFVALTNEQDEPVLMLNRGVPELVNSVQGAIKTQWDSRDDVAGLTTLPPWTGPEDLEQTVIAPGAYIPTWRNGEVQPFRLPPPDGRSIEIENTLRTSVDRYFGLFSKNVPDQLTQLLGQSGVMWFLTAWSRVLALMAQIIQQRMGNLEGARIAGTQIVFDATRESVRGSFDFRVDFDVKSLDLDWFKEVLNFAKDAMNNFDQKNLTDRRVFLEMCYNMIDPTLADRALRTDQQASDAEIQEMRRILSSIFSGDSQPEFPMGVDYKARSDYMQQDLAQSPVRQQIMQTVPAIRAVWEDYLQRLLFQTEQQTTNKQAGIMGGSDPLRQSPLAMLKAGGYQAMLGAQQPQQPALAA